MPTVRRFPVITLSYALISLGCDIISLAISMAPGWLISFINKFRRLRKFSSAVSLLFYVGPFSLSKARLMLVYLHYFSLFERVIFVSKPSKTVYLMFLILVHSLFFCGALGVEDIGKIFCIASIQCVSKVFIRASIPVPPKWHFPLQYFLILNGIIDLVTGVSIVPSIAGTLAGATVYFFLFIFPIKFGISIYKSPKFLSRLMDSC